MKDQKSKRKKVKYKEVVGWINRRKDSDGRAVYLLLCEAFKNLPGLIFRKRTHVFNFFSIQKSWSYSVTKCKLMQDLKAKARG